MFHLTASLEGEASGLVNLTCIDFSQKQYSNKSKNIFYCLEKVLQNNWTMTYLWNHRRLNSKKEINIDSISCIYKGPNIESISSHGRHHSICKNSNLLIPQLFKILCNTEKPEQKKKEKAEGKDYTLLGFCTRDKSSEKMGI